MSRRHLRVVPGDVVEVKERATIFARVVPAPAHDEALGLARLDPDLLRQIGVRPGDPVFLRTPPSHVARQVTLRRVEDPPAEPGKVGAWSLLDDEILIVGDVMQVGAEADKRADEAHVSIAGLQLVTVDVRRARFEPATVRVDYTEPDGPVRVARSTKIELLPDNREAR